MGGGQELGAGQGQNPGVGRGRGRGWGRGCTLVRKSLLLSRLESCPSPCSTVGRLLSGTPRSRCKGDSWCPGKKTLSAYSL